MGKWRILLAFFCILSLLTALSGCRKAADTEAGSSGSRDNTPQVLVPTAPGTSVIGNERISLDISNTAEGYLCARYAGSASRIKIFIITPDEVKYTYDLTAADDWAVLPLTGGNGVYQIEVYENVEGTSYSTLFKEPSLPVSLNDEFRPFLYPNQYTWFTADSETVKKAAELAQNADSDLDVITNVYNFTIGTIVYDDDKAAEAETGALAGYLPDVDQVLESGKGICFDYAAVMTAMLRSQGIPVKLEIGYSGEAYHAWISAWVDEIG